MYSASGDGAPYGQPWIDRVHDLTLASGATVDRVVAVTGNWDERDSAWAQVVDANRVAAVSSPTGASPAAVLLNLDTGSTVPLGSATSIVGVIH
jgi:hypothetical protein